MRIPPEKFSHDVVVALSDTDREGRLRELESFVNPRLQAHRTLADFQRELYAIIEQLNALGHFLGRWDYDSEIEYWGGRSYMDQSIKDELLLRSEFRHGIRLAWGDYDALHKPVN